MSLPANVSYFMQRLQGVSTSHFKINPQTSGNQTSGKLIRFELPTNSLVKMSPRLFFGAVATGTDGAISLPADVSSFIERVSVYMGGVLVSNGHQGYNTLVHAKKVLTGDKCNPTLGHPEIVRAKSYHNGATFGNTAPETYADNGREHFCIDNWEGLLGSLEPNIIDTGLFPQITIELTLADDTVCGTSLGRKIGDKIGTAKTATAGLTDGGTALTFDAHGTVAPGYILNEMTMQVEVLGMSSNVLDAIVEQRIASVGYLSLPFKNYYSYQSTHTNTSRFNVNSASWDRLWLVYRPTDYTTKAAPRVAEGYKIKGGFLGATDGASTTTIDAGLPQYDAGGTSFADGEKYISNYFRFQEKKTDATANAFFQLQVNSANIPAYRMTTPEALSMSLNSVDVPSKKHMSLKQYTTDHFVQCYRFCLPDSDFSRMASGLDTRSVSAQGSLITDNIAECSLVMFAECTSELRVGSSRAIEVIF